MKALSFDEVKRRLRCLYEMDADVSLDPAEQGEVRALETALVATKERDALADLVGDLAQCQIITDAFDGYRWPDVPVELVERAKKLMGHFRGES